MTVILAQLSHDITNQAQDAKVKGQAMTTQAIRYIAPHPQQQVTTMASSLRDFSRINLSTFNKSRVDEDPQEFINEAYRIQYAMGVCLSEKAELATYQLKDVAQTGNV